MTSDIEDRLAAAGQRWRAAQPAPPPAAPSRFATPKQTWVRPARWAPLAAAAAIAVLVAGIGVVRATDREPAPGATGAPTEPQDPLALIGAWRLTGTGTEPGAILRFSRSEMALWRACGIVDGPWRADTNGLFIGELSGFKVQCPAPHLDQTVAWLHTAVAFRVDGDARELLDAAGEPVARLLPGGEPTPEPGRLTEPLDITDEMRRDFAEAAPLPPGFAPVDRDTLLGRWLPVAPKVTRPVEPYVEMKADHDWRGSDGCNGVGGRWNSGAEGAMIGLSGMQTEMGCSNVEVAAWMSAARRAGMDGDELVLFDRTGTELGRLRRP